MKFYKKGVTVTRCHVLELQPDARGAHIELDVVDSALCLSVWDKKGTAAADITIEQLQALITEARTLIKSEVRASQRKLKEGASRRKA